MTLLFVKEDYLINCLFCFPLITLPGTIIPYLYRTMISPNTIFQFIRSSGAHSSLIRHLALSVPRYIGQNYLLLYLGSSPFPCIKRGGKIQLPIDYIFYSNYFNYKTFQIKFHNLNII